MAYTKNPYLPKVRAQAVNMVRRGKGVREVARYIGVSPGTITKWCQKAPAWGYVSEIITLSSRPDRHPHSLSVEVIDRICVLRRQLRRSAEVIHQHLLAEGISVSLSSVKRTLDREGLLKKRSPFKRYHQSPARPPVSKPGDLVELDTIHRGPARPGRLYVYTMIDVYSRWAWAKIGLRINTRASVIFLAEGKRRAPFSFRMLQSDNGPEFSTHFTERAGITHRHSRVRRPNDNAHLERFNRTIQEECLDRISETEKSYKKAIPEYLHYYNHERLHFGIQLKTPVQFMEECFQAID